MKKMTVIMVIKASNCCKHLLNPNISLKSPSQPHTLANDHNILEDQDNKRKDVLTKGKHFKREGPFPDRIEEGCNNIIAHYEESCDDHAFSKL